MKDKLRKSFYVASLAALLVGCKDSTDVPDPVKPPVDKEILQLDHTAGLWEAEVTELPRKATEESSAYINKVYQYTPAIGQFVNKLPMYGEGDKEQDMLNKVATSLVGDNTEFITLGGFGGYVLFGFDHTIENRVGLRDFRVLGNAFNTNVEPGIILVSYDVNNNGKPDDPWFEIRGSEYNNAIKNYTITYYNPEYSDWELSDEHYVKWEDSEGESGFISKNGFHKQPYFPAWIGAKKVVVRGNRLPGNLVQEGIIKLLPFEYGYADNHPNTSAESAIDIDWAVDKNGELVHLPGIDFVKVYTGQFQDGGILGETSTEVSGAVDLHLLEEEIPTREDVNAFVVSHAVGKGLASYTPITRIANEDSKWHITEVFDFMPSYGQFTNELPKWKEGDTHENMVAKVKESLAKEQAGMITLGGYGGYVVVGFDHTIENKTGFRDIRVLGNAFWANANPDPTKPARGGSCEPGIIMVAYDQNKNGLPDDEWYEIRGSEYDRAVKNYEMIFWKPDPNKEPVKDPDNGWMVDAEYMKWKNNQGESGYKPQNNFHRQSYYPNWIAEDKILFKGSLLPKNAVDESGKGSYWVLYSFDFGYADNAPNSDDESAIDIDWAVNNQGERVNLPGVDFIKIYNGSDQEAGWLGETSTEVAGVIDLHLKGESIPTRVVDF